MRGALVRPVCCEVVAELGFAQAAGSVTALLGAGGIPVYRPLNR